MVAPAGYGKTHLITEAITHAEGKPQLVLTHTHAGVDAIVKKLRTGDAKSSQYQVETLDGWAMKWAKAYPSISGLDPATCALEIDWPLIRRGIAEILNHDFSKRIISNSYSGLFVDEYQDCCPLQHQIITALADILPVRVLGDPMQGIFDFGENQIVHWENDVEREFEVLPTLDVPWRWNGINTALGRGLHTLREHLEAGHSVDLSQGAYNSIHFFQSDGHDIEQRARRHFFKLLQSIQQGERIALIFPQRWQSNIFSRGLRGQATALETVECKEVSNDIQNVIESEGDERGLKLVILLKKCMTSIPRVLATPINHLNDGQLPDVGRLRNYKEQAAALREAIIQDDSASLLCLIETLQSTPEVITYRKEYVSRLVRALRGCCEDNSLAILDSLACVRERDRITGRTNYGHVVGTTLLLKGLEFDHVIVVRAHELTKKNLYVALTRGTKSATVISNTNRLRFE
jgi:DNA helicase-2/ATP-dependent DNA helicase PcrA